MIALILDTTTKLLVVGLANKEECCYKYIDSIQIESYQSQNESLIPTIEILLKRNNIFKHDIDEIVVSEGPGSYTGLRISLTFTKVFCLTYPDTIVYTINSLLSYSHNVNGFSIIDARSNRYYGAAIQDGSVIDMRIYINEELQNIENLTGETFKILGQDNIKNVTKNIIMHQNKWRKIENIDSLTPLYLK